MKFLNIFNMTLITFSVFSVSGANAGELAENELNHAWGSDGNISSIEAYGATDSTAIIVQKSSGGWGGNQSKIKMSGRGNFSYSHQEGHYNRSYIEQDGDNNYAAVSQHGFGNDGSIEQYGNGNIAILSQNGIGHSDSITQRGDENIAVVVNKPHVIFSGFDINQNGNESVLILNGMSRNILFY
ncbi:curlin subunit CsgB [Photobacterium sp. CAU 1568]|uniref:Curlin subunit CsgB n=1 Tax=Photobacterium arenosum TaxID=2774143 RepID=A0ABR9BIX2_9GAMM|nr:curlin subunit CsgB [Photobacterium arenosum]MBD8512489.1 curlin subunit CsgB [Photobacterium arenosum]